MLKKETSSLVRRPPCPSYCGVCDHYDMNIYILLIVNKP